MTTRSLRIGLGSCLAALVGSSIIFYHRQNAGLQIGGEISLPKMLWLGYALAAWFVLPFFLWRDERLSPAVRRVFGVFLLLLVARGAVQLPLMYVFQHWNPLYNIGYTLFCLLVVLALRRRLEPADVPSRRALRFQRWIMVGQVADMTFAAMFLQTGAHENSVYFASTEASWGYINFVTWLVVLVLYPNLLWTLATLYYPGVRRDVPRLLRWAGAATAFLTASVAVAAAVFWTHMMRTDREAARFQRIGTEIIDSCLKFKQAFLQADEAAMADFVAGGEADWSLERTAHSHPFELQRWRSGGPQRPLQAAFAEWRRSRPKVHEAAFKMHLLDEIVSDVEAVARIHFEVTGIDLTGQHTTDEGLLRCRFQQGEDERWLVTESSVVEGTTVAGPGTHFVDLAAERGLDFVMEPDRRFTPGASCSCREEAQGAEQLKFQTMRHAYAGCATADYDGDGHDDVLFCSGGRLRLYRNRGDGSFVETTEAAGLGNLWHINTAGFADLDNDGHADLFATAFYGQTYLFANNGDGTFTDVTARSGLVHHGMVTCFCFFDFNNDGRLDLYLGRFLDARTAIPDSFLYARNGEPNVLYRNDGGLHFTDVTAEAGVGDRGLTLSLAAADYDGDGWQDLYVANDFGRNVLYHNEGNGTFRDAAKQTGTLAIGGSMSASWGDYDNDGRLDLYVGAIRSNQRWFVQPITARRVLYKYIREGRLLTSNPLFRDLKENLGDDWVNIGNHAMAGNSLLRQQADGTFADEAEAAGARPTGWYWSCGFCDIDNDGHEDIYATNGWISGPDKHDL